MTLTLKQCQRCKKRKSLKHFGPRSNRKAHPYKSICKPCEAGQQAELRASDPTYRMRSALKTMYGITIEQYNEMLDRQGGVCAICGEEETRTNKGTIRALCVDHNHDTGMVRGLLCANCNNGIGYLGDSADRVRSALEYLEHHD